MYTKPAIVFLTATALLYSCAGCSTEEPAIENRQLNAMLAALKEHKIDKNAMSQLKGLRADDTVVFFGPPDDIGDFKYPGLPLWKDTTDEEIRKYRKTTRARALYYSGGVLVVNLDGEIMEIEVSRTVLAE